MEAKAQRDEILAKLAQFNWHDSKLVELHLAKNREKDCHDLRLDLDLIEDYSGGKSKYVIRSVWFRECRILQVDLDLLGLSFTGGHISSLVAYTNVLELEKTRRDKLRDFDLPQEQNLLVDCLCFHVEMIHPGGEVIIFARDFEVV